MTLSTRPAGCVPPEARTVTSPRGRRPLVPVPSVLSQKGPGTVSRQLTRVLISCKEQTLAVPRGGYPGKATPTPTPCRHTCRTAETHETTPPRVLSPECSGSPSFVPGHSDGEHSFGGRVGFANPSHGGTRPGGRRRTSPVVLGTPRVPTSPAVSGDVGVQSLDASRVVLRRP